MPHAEPAEHAEKRFRELGAFRVQPRKTNAARGTGGTRREKIPQARRVQRATPEHECRTRNPPNPQKKDYASSARYACSPGSRTPHPESAEPAERRFREFGAFCVQPRVTGVLTA